MTIEEQEARWKDAIKDLRQLWFAIPPHQEGPRKKIGTDSCWELLFVFPTPRNPYVKGWARQAPNTARPTYWLPPEVVHEALLRHAAQFGVTPQWAAIAVAGKSNIEHYTAGQEVLLATLPRQAQMLLEMHNLGVMPLPLPSQTGNPPSA